MVWDRTCERKGPNSFKRTMKYAKNFHITKIKLNSIYNSHFTGSPVWNLYCREAEAIEKTWNVAVRKMFQLRHSTHRYFIEPLSDTRHIKLALIRKFINFTQKITNSTKTPMKTLYNCIRKDCRSTTGNNLRRILLFLDVNIIDCINMKSLEKMKYHEASNDNEKRRIAMVKELIDVKRKQCHLENFTTIEIDRILEYLCTT